MEVHKTQLPGSRVELKLQLSAEDVDKAYGQVFEELSDQGGIPGFRPGKAPPVIIRRRYDEDMLQELAWVRLIEEHYPTLVEDEKLEPLEDPSFPDLENLDFGENKPVEFSITLTVRPRPTIEQYKGLHIFKPSAEVTEKDIEDILEEFREAGAEDVEVDREEVAEGDLVTATLTVLADGAEEPLTKGEQDFVVGGDRYAPAIDQEMLGKKIGDTVSLEYEYPEDHEDAELAGKKATVSATIDQIMERKLPELDDEFAATQGDFETLEEWTEVLTEQLARQSEQQARQEAENNALAAILAGTQIDLPESLVERAAADGFDKFQLDLEREGLSLEAFAEIAQVEEDEVKANETARAEASLKLHFVLDEIRRLEELELDEEDFEAEIARFAESAGVDADFVRQSLQVQEGLEEQLRERAMRNKIINFIIENSEIEEVAREEYEEVKKREREKLEEQAAAASEAVEGVSDAAEDEEVVQDAAGDQAKGEADEEPETEADQAAETPADEVDSAEAAEETKE